MLPVCGPAAGIGAVAVCCVRGQWAPPYDDGVADSAGRPPAASDGESCLSSVSPAGQDAPLRRTIAAVVADRLRTMILQGDLPPGERVKVQRLEETFGVSQIPIRPRLTAAPGPPVLAACAQAAAMTDVTSSS
jgi:hypothetical protein